MASTYSTNLAIELIGTGDQAGTWGVTTNTNLGTLIEQAISGYVTQAVSTGSDTTITIPNGATGVARNMYIELTGTGGTNTNLIVPANKKLYFIFNNTASGQVTVKVSGQTGVSVPNGKKMVLVSNGTDIVNGLNYIADFGTNSFTVTNLTASSGTITNLIATTASISDASATVLRAGSATLTHLSATSASITNLALTSLTISSLSITNVSVASATVSSNLTLSGGTANGVLYLNASKVATSGSALVFDGTNLGIGTASPQTRLHVVGGSATEVRVVSSENLNSGGASFIRFGGSNSATSGYLGYGGTPSTYDVYNGLNGPITFSTNNAERARITSAGDVGIGTTSPVYKLQVETASASSDIVGYFRQSTNPVAYIKSGSGYAAFGQGATNGETRIAADGGGTAFVSFYTGTGTEKMRLDSSGNLGLGVTPSAWSTLTAFQVKNAAIAGYLNNLYAYANTYFDGTNVRYIASDFATQYRQTGGQHQFYTAPSGTAGNAITFTQAMTLDASGNLGIGATIPEAKLHVLKDSTSTDFTGVNYPAETSGLLVNNSNSVNGGFTGMTMRVYNGASNQAASILAVATGSGTSPNIVFTQRTANNVNTERARITAGGFFKASDSGTYQSAGASYHEFVNTTNNETVIVTNTNASFDASVLQIRASRNTTNNTFYALAYYNLGAAAYKFRVADSGAIATAGGIALGTDTPATSGVGVQFPATQSASSNANTLDDYEEGNWTPTVTANSGAFGAGNTVTTDGKYTKIGNTVRAWCKFSASSVGTAVNANVSGLPFSQQQTGVQIAPFSVVNASNNTFTGGVVDYDAATATVICAWVNNHTFHCEMIYAAA